MEQEAGNLVLRLVQPEEEEEASRRLVQGQKREVTQVADYSSFLLGARGLTCRQNLSDLP
jgi:hypothetical protein